MRCSGTILKRGEDGGKRRKKERKRRDSSYKFKAMTAMVTYFLHADEKKAASVSLYYYGVLTYTPSTRTSFPETPTISLSSETAACHSCLKPKRGRKIDKEVSILGMMTWAFFFVHSAPVKFFSLLFRGTHFKGSSSSPPPPINFFWCSPRRRESGDVGSRGARPRKST